MKVKSTFFWTQKEGNPKDEYEDAYCPKIATESNRTELAFAVADGATEGMLCRIWANILVRSFCLDQYLQEDPMLFMKRADDKWKKFFAKYPYVREKKGKPIQWYEEDGLQNGAFSTLLGLRLIQSADDQNGRWEAVAVGDSCLFQIRNDSLIAKFPLEHSEDFNNSPYLIPSNRKRGADLEHHFKKMKDEEFLVGDKFYLMTDALACWFLRRCEDNNKSTKFFQHFCDDDSDKSRDFHQWVSGLRKEEKMRNDDTTFLRIEILE